MLLLMKVSASEDDAVRLQTIKSQLSDKQIFVKNIMFIIKTVQPFYITHHVIKGTATCGRGNFSECSKFLVLR